jgi:hypothetical protein
MEHQGLPPGVQRGNPPWSNPQGKRSSDGVLSSGEETSEQKGTVLSTEREFVSVERRNVCR